MQNRKTLAAAAFAVVVLAGCTDAVGLADSATRPGVLQLVGYGPQPLLGYTESMVWRVDLDSNVLSPRDPLMVPDTVEAGVAFEVVATTIGLDGCWRAGTQDVQVADGVVALTPSDVHSGARVCTQVLSDLTHTSMVTVPTPGDWTVRVAGRKVRNGDDVWNEPVTAETKVVVR
jgi:hypothetical protein